MKIKKMVSVFLIVAVFLSMAAVSVSADELFPGSRWDHTVMKNGVRQCYVYLNTDRLTGGWGSAVSRAVSNWNDYSDDKVKVTMTSYDFSTVDMSTRTGTWPYGSDSMALTSLYDRDGYSVSGYDWISRAIVFFNPSYSNTTAFDYRAKMIGHEIGHCLNLGHRLNQTSIMSYSSDYLDYDKPTYLDTRDLKNYYGSWIK